MRAAALQLPVTMDVTANLQMIEAALAAIETETFVVAPEGILSGYLPTGDLVDRLDNAATLSAVESARALSARFRVHLIAGACVNVAGHWRNRSYYLGPTGASAVYDKVNLAQSERGSFAAGDELPVFDIDVAGERVRFGIQMCREIRYPEQWRHLADQGAQVVAYVNNAVGSLTGPSLWRSHVISRAAECQRFVVGANNAQPQQTCTSLIVSPDGEVVAEAAEGSTSSITADLDLSAVSNWTIDQARKDIVNVAGPSLEVRTPH